MHLAYRPAGRIVQYHIQALLGTLHPYQAVRFCELKLRRNGMNIAIFKEV